MERKHLLNWQISQPYEAGHTQLMWAYITMLWSKHISVFNNIIITTTIDILKIDVLFPIPSQSSLIVTLAQHR